MIENSASHIAASMGGYSPQHRNNFTIEFYGVANSTILSLSLSRGFLPQWKSNEGMIRFANERAYFAGAVEWGAGTIEFNDYVDRDVQGIIVAWVARVYPGILNPVDGRVGQPKDYKRDGNVIIWAPDGTAIRLWKLLGCWPYDFNPGELNMESNDPVRVTLGIRYDKAVYLGPSTNYEVDSTIVGAAVNVLQGIQL
jgi:hypothetical protein